MAERNVSAAPPCPGGAARYVRVPLDHSGVRRADASITSPSGTPRNSRVAVVVTRARPPASRTCSSRAFDCVLVAAWVEVPPVAAMHLQPPPRSSLPASSRSRSCRWRCSAIQDEQSVGVERYRDGRTGLDLDLDHAAIAATRAPAGMAVESGGQARARALVAFSPSGTAWSVVPGAAGMWISEAVLRHLPLQVLPDLEGLAGPVKP